MPPCYHRSQITIFQFHNPIMVYLLVRKLHSGLEVNFNKYAQIKSPINFQINNKE